MKKADFSIAPDGAILLSGHCSYETIGPLWPRILKQLKKNGKHPRLICDLSQVKYADSTCLALLLSLKRRLKQNKSHLEFHHIPPQLMALATVNGIGTMLT